MPLEKQGLKEFTLHFLMILNLKYWCNDEAEKNGLEKYMQKMRESIKKR